MPGNNRNRINNLIEPDFDLGEIKDRSGLVVGLTAFMDEIRHDLSAKKEHDILKFVRLLVGEKYASRSPFKENGGLLFCRNYCAAIFKEYIPNEDKDEYEYEYVYSLFMSVNGLSAEYANLSLTKRIERFANRQGCSTKTVYNHLKGKAPKVCEELADQICILGRKNLWALADEVFSQLADCLNDTDEEIPNADDAIDSDGASSPENVAEGHMNAPRWGDSDGGRSSFTASQVRYGILGNQIVFNSIDGEHRPGDCKAVYPGDEREFVEVLRPDTDPEDNASWEGERITIEDAKHYMIRLHIDNNNCRGYEAVAKDTKVALSIPTYSDIQITVRGYIESINATPPKYWDGIVFTSTGDRPFHLKFKPDTAMIHNNSTKTNGAQLSNDIVLKATEGGALIGYDALNGEIPGGSSFQSKVTAWIVATYDPFAVISKVRKLGEKDWHEAVDAKIGDQVEFQIEYHNASTEEQVNVMISDVLPGNLKYVPGTTKLYNMNHPNWASIKKDDIVTRRGINIGIYKGSADGTQGGNAFIRFTAEVVDTDLAYGENFIYNWGQATVNNSLIENPSIVIVQKFEQ